MFSNWSVYQTVQARLFRRQSPETALQDQAVNQTKSESGAPSSESLKSTQNSNEKCQDTTLLLSEDVIITDDAVEKVGACFKHLVEECSKDSSVSGLGLNSTPFLKNTIVMATSMAKRPSVQEAVFAEANADPDFMKKVEDAGEEIGCLQLVDNQNADGRKEDDDKDPTYKQILDCLWRLYNNVVGRVNQAKSWLIEEIMLCFKVAKDVASEILATIQNCFLWMVRTIMDLKGEIRKLLDDPEKPNGDKVLGIVGAFATAILWAVISQNGHIALRTVGPAIGPAIGPALGACVVAVKSYESKQILSPIKSVYGYFKKVQ